MMGKRMPTAYGTRYFYGTINPIHGNGDHPGRICLKGKLGQFEEIVNLGRKNILLIIA